MLKKEDIEKIRKDYPKGTRIKFMDDPFQPVPSRTIGTVKGVDDAGQIQTPWENGSNLSIVLEVDEFEIIEKPQDNLIKVLIVEPKKVPYIKEINKKLKTMQEIVGGLIEEISLSETASLVCNEKGKLCQLENNRKVRDDIIVGTFFIVGNDGGEEYTSLSDDNIQKYSQRFATLETHSQEEVQEEILMKFFNGC